MFLIGSFIAWFLWTQQARPDVFHVPVYHPPALTVSLGVLAIALLAVAAYGVREAGRTPSDRVPPRPWVMTTAALVLGFPWYLLMVLVFSPHPPDVPLPIAMALACAWAIGAYLLIRRWGSASGWRDTHRWALCFGADPGNSESVGAINVRLVDPGGAPAIAREL